MAKKIKCGATPELVKEHTNTLKELDKRTIRIEASAYTTIALITLFGIIVAFIEYGKKQEQKREYIEKKAEMPTVVRKSDLEHGVYY